MFHRCQIATVVTINTCACIVVEKKDSCSKPVRGFDCADACRRVDACGRSYVRAKTLKPLTGEVNNVSQLLHSVTFCWETLAPGIQDSQKHLHSRVTSGDIT